MAFLQFPSNFLVKTIDTGETVKLGSFQWANDTRLRYARVWFVLVGTSITTEKFRINVLPSYGHSTPIFSSTWSNLSEISGVATNWTGYVRFDFTDEFIDSDITYYLELEPANYTRSGDSTYIAAKLESPFDINDVQSVAHNLPVGVEFYGVE